MTVEPLPGRSPEPAVSRPAQALTGALFAALSGLRGKRFVHPDGLGFEAVLDVPRAQPRYADVPFLARPGRHRAVVRASRALGLPEPLVDWLGLAVRLLDVHGPGRHQDLLLISSADRPVLHHLLLPAPRGFFRQSFSSSLVYRVGDAVRLAGLVPESRPPREPGDPLRELDRAAARGDARFSLALAPLAGRWAPVGELSLGARLPAGVTEDLRFNPWRTGEGIRPAGPFNGIRKVAYAASQAGRGAA
jgi:hypothetical protein